MWLTILSDQLPVVALVGRYLTNKLIGREPIQKRQVTEVIPTFNTGKMPFRTIRGINPSFLGLSPSFGQVAHVLRTRPPLEF